MATDIHEQTQQQRSGENLVSPSPSAVSGIGRKIKALLTATLALVAGGGGYVAYRLVQEGNDYLQVSGDPLSREDAKIYETLDELRLLEKNPEFLRVYNDFLYAKEKKYFDRDHGNNFSNQARELAKLSMNARRANKPEQAEQHIEDAMAALNIPIGHTPDGKAVLPPDSHFADVHRGKGDLYFDKDPKKAAESYALALQRMPDKTLDMEMVCKIAKGNPQYPLPELTRENIERAITHHNSISIVRDVASSDIVIRVQQHKAKLENDAADRSLEEMGKQLHVRIVGQ